MSALGWILALVAAQRLGELVLAGRNTRALLARGGRELGAGHYPFFPLLHGAWLIAIAITVPWTTEPYWPLLGVFALLQVARLWVIATLGQFWTTRIVTLDGAPLVTRGPYRFVRHPNYWIVVLEIAVLPLAFGAVGVALVFSLLNACLLAYRIRIEAAALRPRAVPVASERTARSEAPET